MGHQSLTGRIQDLVVVICNLFLRYFVYKFWFSYCFHFIEKVESSKFSLCILKFRIKIEIEETGKLFSL